MQQKFDLLIRNAIIVVQRILKFDQTMIGSGGLPHDAAPHPRL